MAYALIVYDQHGYFIENVIPDESVSALKSHIPEEALHYAPNPEDKWLVAFAASDTHDYYVIEVTT